MANLHADEQRAFWASFANLVASLASADPRLAATMLRLQPLLATVLQPVLGHDQPSRVCPLCLEVLVAFSGKDEHQATTKAMLPLISMLRAHGHAFLDACIYMITAPRTEADVLALQQRLVSNVRSCIKHRHDCKDSPPELYRAFFETIFLWVNLCFTAGDRMSLLSRARRLDKGFHSRGVSNVWPTSPEQLMPRSAQQTVTALLDWCCTNVSLGAIQTLTSYIIILRPHLFPYFIKSPLRARLMWLVVRLLLNDFSHALEDWPGTEEPCVPPGPPTIEGLPLPEHEHLLVMAGTAFVVILVAGPDAQGDDLPFLVRGYEHILLRAVQSAMRVLDEVKEASEFAHLRHLAISLYLCTKGPEDALDPRALHFLKTNPANYDLGRLRDLHFTLWLFFKQLYARRSCAGPDCAKALQDNEGGRPFNRCARCRMPAYCGRQCQKDDWKRGPPIVLPWARETARHARHKDMCPIICRVFHEASLEMEPDDFAEAVRRVGLTTEDMTSLVEWALSTHVLPPAIAIEMAGQADIAGAMSREEYSHYIAWLGLWNPKDPRRFDDSP